MIVAKAEMLVFHALGSSHGTGEMAKKWLE